MKVTQEAFLLCAVELGSHTEHDQLCVVTRCSVVYAMIYLLCACRAFEHFADEGRTLRYLTDNVDVATYNCKDVWCLLPLDTSTAEDWVILFPE